MSGGLKEYVFLLLLFHFWLYVAEILAVCGDYAENKSYVVTINICFNFRVWGVWKLKWMEDPEHIPCIFNVSSEQDNSGRGFAAMLNFAV